MGWVERKTIGVNREPVSILNPLSFASLFYGTGYEEKTNLHQNKVLSLFLPLFPSCICAVV